MRIQDNRGMFKRVSMEERFWEKVDKRGPDECWLWQGAPEKTGYAKITDFWDKFYVHRYSYELHYAIIPRWLPIQVTHSCDVRLCVNPKHLWLGTAQSNADECVKRGRTSHQGPGNPAKGERQPNAKLTEETVRAIRRRYRTEAVTLEQLGKEYGVRTTTVHAVIKRRTWAHVD